MNIQDKTINTLRMLSVDMVQQANSGHPGAPMGMAPMAYALWLNTMKHDPGRPDWPNRDRFILSNGHASALLYSLLHLGGYQDMTMEQLKNFRQWQSITPGHPEHGLAAGVDTTTGPLGQGFANAVGFAIAETMLAARFNRPGFPLVDHHTYVFAGDGCLMEGVASEAASLAGTLRLNKLTVLYDANQVCIEGHTDLTFQEDVGGRFRAYGWQVIQVADGDDHRQVRLALEQAKGADRPTLIICPTTIGFGSVSKAGHHSVHSGALGADEISRSKVALGMPDKPFHVEQAVYDHARECLAWGKKAREDWDALLAAYQAAHPELAAEWARWHSTLDARDLLGEGGLLRQVSGLEAPRFSSGQAINALARLVPNLVGGSADLAPSNKSYIEGGGDYSAENRLGRNLRFGVREHAMAAICNGIALHGGLRVFCATFFVFVDYMKPAVRLSAIMGLPVIFVLTHDSIGVGEDGTTHQPVEQLTALRAMPGLRVIRPCDAGETALAWAQALTSQGPTCLVLAKQDVPQFERTADSFYQGAYVLLPASKREPDLIMMGTGSEVGLLAQAQQQLKEKGIDASVVSMPDMGAFLELPEAERNKVLPPAVTRRLAVEAGATLPWYRLVGPHGRVLGIDRFGASAPIQALYEQYGLTVPAVVALAEELCGG